MKPNHIDVQVITTSGAFPAVGFDEVPVNQPVKVELAEAQRKLGIASTDGWVAVVGNREIDTSRSYADNGLSGRVTIDWGPREGGGGKGVARDA